MNKKIVTIAEIAFALIFVVLMATLFSNIYNAGSNINLDIENMQQTINDAELTSYDNKTVSGDTVMSTINKLNETRNGLAMSYAVCKSSGDAAQSNEANWCFFGHKGIVYENNSASDESALTLFNAEGKKITGLGYSKASSDYVKHDTNIKPGDNSVTGDCYISPVATYVSQLAFNKNGVLVGMVFIPE